MPNLECPDYSRIIYFLHGLTTEEEGNDITKHVAACLKCQVNLREATQLLAFAREEATLEPSIQAHQRVLNLFRVWNNARQQAEVKTSGLQWLLGKLVLDSRRKGHFASSLAGGMRSENPTPGGSSYQLLFNLAEGQMEVDLQVQPLSREGYFNVIGQLVGFSGQERQVELVRTDGSPVATVTADETFTFRFQDVAAGEFLLRLHDGQTPVELNVTF